MHAPKPNRPIKIPHDAVNLTDVYPDEHELRACGCDCPIWFSPAALAHFSQGGANRGPAGAVGCVTLLHAIKSATSRPPFPDEADSVRVIRSRMFSRTGEPLALNIRVEEFEVPGDIHGEETSYLVSLQSEHEPALRETVSAN